MPTSAAAFQFDRLVTSLGQEVTDQDDVPDEHEPGEEHHIRERSLFAMVAIVLVLNWRDFNYVKRRIYPILYVALVLGFICLL